MKLGKKHLILTLVVIAPVAWLLLWKNFKHVAVKLPIMGERTVMDNGDTLYHTIGDFSFINQNGDSVTADSFSNKIYVASFFFTSCPEICPKINVNLKIAVDKFKTHPSVRFISHTIDPYNDTVEALKSYAEHFDAVPPKWNMVTGSKHRLYSVAREDYLVTAVQGSGPDDFFHSEKLVLIDKDKRIRGYFDGLDFKEILRLMDEIKVLLIEYNENPHL